MLCERYGRIDACAGEASRVRCNEAQTRSPLLSHKNDEQINPVIKPKAPKLLTTPNLTEAQVSLTDFLKQKNVTEMMDKYSVVAVWYKEQFQIVDINIDRIFTAFKVLGQESQLPTDIEKPLKNLTYVKKWFEKAKAPNTYNIIWLGESEVGKMGAGAVKA